MGVLASSIAELHSEYMAGLADPEECAERVIEQVMRSQATLRAFTTLCETEAKAQAESSRRRVAAGHPRSVLDGVPVAVKDVFSYGLTSYGSAGRRQNLPARSASAVAALRRAGAVVIGKTTPWEYSLGEPQPRRWPPRARNPWDLRRDPGGSSSGAAAAVAGGLVYGSLATDSAGSTRGPAAYCGVVGIKPSWGRIPLRGASPLSPALDHGGLIARRVDDVRALLAAFSGNADSTAKVEGRQGLQGVRVGVPSSLFSPFVETSVARLFEDATRLLARLGARLQEVETPPADQIGVVTWIILLRDAAQLLRRRLGVRVADVGSDLRGLLQLGSLIDGRTYARARRDQAGIAAEIESAFDRVDLIATPTTPSIAPLLARQWKGSHAIGDPPEATFMSIFNLAHVPAISLPAGSAGGLPVGLQLAARFGQDDFLLRCAAGFEAAAEWADSTPRNRLGEPREMT